MWIFFRRILRRKSPHSTRIRPGCCTAPAAAGAKRVWRHFRNWASNPSCISTEDSKHGRKRDCPLKKQNNGSFHRPTDDSIQRIHPASEHHVRSEERRVGIE